MSLIYNGTTIENAIYNGTTLEKIIFNGTEVFSAGFTLNVTISSNTTNYNIASAATALGWDGVKKLKGTITINSGVYVYSTSTGTPAFSTGTIPSGSDVTVVNNGTIVGRGGDGGNAGLSQTYGSGATSYGSTGSAGYSGGIGFYATSSIKVTNNGRIAGGGGGGGGGGTGRPSTIVYFGSYYSYPHYCGSGGGGGGGGIGNSTGGTSLQYSVYDYTIDGPRYCGMPSGSSGTLTSPGSGQAGNSSSGYDPDAELSYWGYGGTGGAGGSYGSGGSSGGTGTTGTDRGYVSNYGGGSGGGAGAAVVGSANITWNATGTRNGAIS